jgi:hypothetical protein
MTSTTTRILTAGLLLIVALLLLARCSGGFSDRAVWLCVFRVAGTPTRCTSVFPADDFSFDQTQNGKHGIALTISREAERFFNEFIAGADGSTLELLDPQTGAVLITLPKVRGSVPNPFVVEVDPAREAELLRRLRSVRF